MEHSHNRPRTLIAGVDASIQHKLAREFAVCDLGAAETCADLCAAPELVQQDPQRFDVVLLRLQPSATANRGVLRRLAALHYPGQILLAGDGEPRRLQAAEAAARAQGLRILGSVSSPEALSRLRALYARIESARLRHTAPQSPAYAASRLRQAIDSGEFCSHYQPKVMFDSGHVIGVEALARWQHPEDGLLPPDAFLSLAEAERLTTPLAQTLLHEHLRDLRAWHDTGLDLSLSFNTEGTDLAAPNLADALAGNSAAERDPRLRLICEVSEARLGTAARSVRAAAKRLLGQHVGLAIDNFGGGDVTAARLRRLPIEELKIDRAFVHGAAHDPSLRAIVETGLQVARDLGVRSVAEGVEDRADWELMRALGCDAAQGYFVAPPLPAAEVPGWIAHWHERQRESARPPRAHC